MSMGQFQQSIPNHSDLIVFFCMYILMYICRKSASFFCEIGWEFSPWKRSYLFQEGLPQE